MQSVVIGAVSLYAARGVYWDCLVATVSAGGVVELRGCVVRAAPWPSMPGWAPGGIPQDTGVSVVPPHM